jgi:hypothetical protein
MSFINDKETCRFPSVGNPALFLCLSRLDFSLFWKSLRLHSFWKSNLSGFRLSLAIGNKLSFFSLLSLLSLLLTLSPFTVCINLSVGLSIYLFIYVSVLSISLSCLSIYLYSSPSAPLSLVLSLSSLPLSISLSLSFSLYRSLSLPTYLHQPRKFAFFSSTYYIWNPQSFPS